MAMIDSNRFVRWAAALGAACLLLGCAPLFEGRAHRLPEAVYLPDSRAAEVLDRLARLNAGIETFKGVGKIKIVTEGQLRSARILWAGMAPDRLRIEILGLPGQPVASLALDGDRISFDGHAEGRFYTHKIGTDSLKPILSIDVTAADIMELMRGRLPIRPHSAVTLYRYPPETGYVLQLDKRWWETREKIFLDESLTQVRRIEILDFDDGLVYRADFDGVQTVDGYRIFRRAILSNDNGDRFELEILRYFANAEVDPAAFVLIPRS